MPGDSTPSSFVTRMRIGSRYRRPVPKAQTRSGASGEFAAVANHKVRATVSSLVHWAQRSRRRIRRIVRARGASSSNRRSTGRSRVAVTSGTWAVTEPARSAIPAADSFVPTPWPDATPSDSSTVRRAPTGHRHRPALAIRGRCSSVASRITRSATTTCRSVIRWPRPRRSAGAAPEQVAIHYLELLLSSDESIAEALAVLTDPAAYPAVIHCSVGKDRTGILSRCCCRSLVSTTMTSSRTTR